MPLIFSRLTAVFLSKKSDFTIVSRHLAGCVFVFSFVLGWSANHPGTAKLRTTMTDTRKEHYERYFARKLDEYLRRNPADDPGVAQTRISAAASVYLADRNDGQPPAVALDRALNVLYIDFTGNTEII